MVNPTEANTLAQIISEYADVPHVATIELLTSDWSKRLCADIRTAKLSVTLSALSMLTASPNATGQWASCWRAITSAPARGVAVVVYLPAPTRSSAAASQNFRTAQQLLSHGVETHLVPGPHLLHTKSAIIDASTVYIGSGNFTEAAATHNHEAYVRITSNAIATKHAAFLDKLKNR